VEPETSRKFTYGQLYELSHKFAYGLQQDLGLRHQDNVVICLPNCAEYVIAQFAILSSGATVSGMNPAYTEGDE